MTQAAQKRISPRLSLSNEERRSLRRAKIKLSEIADFAPEDLFEFMGETASLDRCRCLVGLAELQRLGSVGPKIAEGFFQIGVYRATELAGQEPVDLYQRLCQATSEKQDPCVEDVFRCAVAQVEEPDLPIEYHQWWMWTSDRGKPRGRKPS
ncbi:MAG: hypothetical protein GY854_20810 [Deltaproteobacteria bacterium]|nr:hypothetical protein [Deltaproteobacteria bacterium]